MIMQNPNEPETVIWSHEFSEEDWESIVARLQTIRPFGAEIRDDSGWNNAGR